VGHALNTFFAWPTHLVKPFLEQVFHFIFLTIIKKGFVTNPVFIVIRLCLLTMYHKQGVKGPAKPIDRSDLDVNPL